MFKKTLIRNASRKIRKNKNYYKNKKAHLKRLKINFENNPKKNKSGMPINWMNKRKKLLLTSNKKNKH